jgi:hypothetical protein
MKRLVVWVLLVGCGGDESNGSIEIDNLGMELGIASCGRQFDCCDDAEIMTQYMGITFDGQPIETEDQCVAFTNALFTSLAVAKYKESIAMGRMEYDGAAAADCVAAIESLSCAEYSTRESADFAPGCGPFVLAKVADGGGCTQSHECTSHNCEGASTPLGGPDTDGMCKPMPTAGQSCEDNCASGLYCGFEQASNMVVCQALKADGTQCNSAKECTSDYCDNSTRLCATKLPTCDGR